MGLNHIPPKSCRLKKLSFQIPMSCVLFCDIKWAACSSCSHEQKTNKFGIQRKFKISFEGCTASFQQVRTGFSPTQDFSTRYYACAFHETCFRFCRSTEKHSTFPRNSASNKVLLKKKETFHGDGACEVSRNLR